MRWVPALLVALLLAACGGGTAAGGAAAAEEVAPGSVTLRLGYFPNLTHAPAIVGVEDELFAEALGPDVSFETRIFNAGPAAIEAVFSESVDAVYIGPNPAINAWAQSHGEAVRLIAGSTSGGAFFVVRDDIQTPQDLRGGRVATPQLGNTQDVALRSWLAEQGLATDPAGGGDVSILPQENAQTLESFASGEIDGAWVPEPWATRLVQEAGGRVLVDERDLWPEGRYVTTHLLVRTDYLDAHPDVIEDLLRGHVAAVDAVNKDPQTAQETVIAGIEAITGSALRAEVVVAAWEHLEFTVDPIASSLVEGARDAEAVGLLDAVDLDGIYHLDPLNAVLAELGRDPVQGAMS
jgi:sulfonate transport system substrate-binding protein